jgi:acetylornithine deacetylase
MEHEQLLKNLVEIKSYSGEEANIRHYIQAWFKERKIESSIQDGNLIVHFEGKDRTKAFIFNSHMDTVSKGEKPWKNDPWTPLKAGSKLFGLGTSDMKAGLTASMLLAEQIDKLGKPPVDIWFTYVTNEEVDGSGTMEFANWFNKSGYTKKYREVAGIFTEPTSLTEVEYGHRGNYFLEVKTTGPSGHASRPWELEGTTAVRKMIKFADAFQDEVHQWNQEFPSEHFTKTITLGEMTSIRANVVTIKKQDETGKELLEVQAGSPNKFADTCIATFDLRTTPDGHDIVYERVKKLGQKLGVEVGLLYPAAPAGFTDPSEKIVQISKSMLGERKVVISLASADLGFLSLQGIKAVILGPGERNQCHMTNEYCYPEQIPQAVEIYKAIIEAWAK